MDRRPISVTLVGSLFIAAGVVGLAYHAPEFDLRHPFEFDLVLGVAIRLLAIAGGVFVLDARAWARWLVTMWLLFHVMLSALDSMGQLAFHVVLLGVISWVLFRPATTPFFRRDERPAPVRL